MPTKRRWQYTDYGEKLNAEYKALNPEKRTGLRFKIATYNLLAPDLLANNWELYRRISEAFLDWEYRKRKIYQELKYLSVDILCMQEMQEEHYHQYFVPKLSYLGKMTKMKVIKKK